MNWLDPEEWMTPELELRLREVQRVPELSVLREFLVGVRGYKLLLVGGATRDLLLGRPVKDFDFLVTCSPQELSALRPEIAAQAGVTVFPLDPVRGYFRVCYRTSEGVDLAALDRPSVWDDLRRRDITFNAMALSHDGRLADPFNGRKDLELRQVRVVARDVLVEDPLRILRCFRMAAVLDFSIDPETVEYLKELAPRLGSVAGERIFDELVRFIQHANPSQWESFSSSGVAEALWNLPQNRLPWNGMRQRWLTAGTDSLDVASVLAALLWREPNREALLQRIKVSRELNDCCRRCWLGWSSLEETTPETSREVYALVTATGDALPGLLEFATLPEFCKPISFELQQRLLREFRKEGELRFTPLPLNGNDLTEHLSRESGPWLGQVLKELRAAWACREFNSRDELLDYSAAMLR